MSCNRANRGRLRLVGCLLIVVIAGCGYGEVSPTAYQYAKAIYSLSNRQTADKIGMVEEQLAAAVESGELSPREADWLTAMCDDCRAGRWEAAQAASRRMMEDQVRR